jgi:hypothetical protein
MLVYSRAQYDQKGKQVFKNGKAVYDAIATHQPLIHLIEGYKGLTKEELEQLRDQGSRPERVTYLLLQPCHLVVDNLKHMHLYKPTGLHQQIEDLVASQRGKRARIPRSYSLFVQYLHTVDFDPFKVSRDLLVDRLLLASYRRQRKLNYAHQQIDQSLEIAYKLGYLLDYEEDALGLLSMRLNTAKLSRVRRKQEKLEQEH